MISLLELIPLVTRRCKWIPLVLVPALSAKGFISSAMGCSPIRPAIRQRINSSHAWNLDCNSIAVTALRKLGCRPMTFTVLSSAPGEDSF